MAYLKYIRDIVGRGPVSSVSTDVFEDDTDGRPYRDLIKAHHITETDDQYIYTIGKCLFPDNFEAVVTMERWILLIVAEGRMKIVDRWLEKGDFMFAPASIPHTLLSKDAMPLYYWCTCDDVILNPIVRECGFGDYVHAGHCKDADHVFELFENVIYKMHGEFNARMYIAGVVTQLLSYFSDTAASTESHMSFRLFERCVTYIEYRQGKVSVDELAAHYHISRQHLYNIFMKNGKASPQKYIMDAKMKAADKYLRTTDFSVAQISEMLMYNNYNHFSQAFKKYYGVLPGERRKNKGDRKLRDE
ncbi:MAG: helix-turn-helix transcriptional regulator [Eubacteriales bacterium]